MSNNQSDAINLEEEREDFVREAPEGSRVELFSTDWKDRPAPLIFEKHEGKWYHIKKLTHKREQRDTEPVEKHSAQFLEERWVKGNDAERVVENSSPSSHFSDSLRIRM